MMAIFRNRQLHPVSCETLVDLKLFSDPCLLLKGRLNFTAFDISHMYFSKYITLLQLQKVKVSGIWSLPAFDPALDQHFW